MKIHFKQQHLFDILNIAIQDAHCDALVRLILTDMRIRLNDKFLFVQEKIKIKLQPYQALALYRYISNKPAYAELLAYELADKLMRKSIVAEKKL